MAATAAPAYRKRPRAMILWLAARVLQSKPRELSVAGKLTCQTPDYHSTDAKQNMSNFCGSMWPKDAGRMHSALPIAIWICLHSGTLSTSE